MERTFADPQTVEFKPAFVERYTKLTDFDVFKKYSLTYLRKSIRVNTLKIPVDELLERLKGLVTLEPIPWCPEGFWVKGQRRDFGNMLEHLIGYFYIQEAASMIPPMVLAPKEDEMILDMCSAPGSKTTQIAQYLKNTGLVIANDVTADRLKSLGFNLQRMGVTNTVITMMPGRLFNGFEFDRILVDAPCSGIGTIRKSYKTIAMWNPDMVRRLSSTQKQLACTAFDNLKSGGTMVYSTCTTEPEENEGVISHILEKYEGAKVEKISLDIKRSPPVMEFNGKEFNPEVKNCLRIWPQDNDTEGFFVTRIRKE